MTNSLETVREINEMVNVRAHDNIHTLSECWLFKCSESILKAVCCMVYTKTNLYCFYLFFTIDHTTKTFFLDTPDWKWPFQTLPKKREYWPKLGKTPSSYSHLNRTLNPFKPDFTIVIFIHYKPRIAVAILDL